MRNLWIKPLTAAMLLAATTVVSSQTPKPDAKPNGKSPPAKDTPAKSQLEQMLELALKKNPDIRVAEAKAREADAALDRVRLAVTQKVVQLYSSLESARAAVDSRQADLNRCKAELDRWQAEVARLNRLAKQGVVDQQTLNEAESQVKVAAAQLEKAKAELVQAKAEVTKLEAEMPYLLGQQKIKWQKDADGQLRLVVEASAEENYKDALQRLATARLAQGGGAEMRLEVREPNLLMGDKIRAALNRILDRVDLAADGPKDVLDWCRDKYGIDINIIVKDPGLKFPKDYGSGGLKDIPFGAVLQWIEDGLPKHCFVVRDYGLVLVPCDQLPEGALRLNEFWKAKPNEFWKSKPMGDKK